MNVWSRIASVIPEKGYSEADLKAILRGWSSLLNDNYGVPDGRDALHTLINHTLQKLKLKSEKEEETILLETLRCMLHKEYFPADDLNQFMKEAGVRYHYVIKKNMRLQEGDFKAGYRKERKRKMEEFDCLFISHAYADHEIVDLFVEFLTNMGLKNEQIFYSSLPEYGVLLGENIADTIQKRLSNKKVHVIFMLSQNYYDSHMCLNEMGAAWVLQHTYTSILLPGFAYEKINGAIKAGNIGMKLDEDQGNLKVRLVQLRKQLQREFALPEMDEITWTRKMENFLNRIKEKIGS